MKTNRQIRAAGSNLGLFSRRSKAITAIFSLLALSTLASPAPPLWWSSRGALNNNPANDNVVVNQGQLKHFTQKAVEELNARLPGGAGNDLNNLVQSWKDAYISQNHSPENPDPADFQAIATGQLKWIAQKIHNRLIYARYEDQTPSWLSQNPTTDSQLANLGQLKTIFAFDLTAAEGQIPEWWQKFYFNTAGLDPNAIPNYGTVSYLTHYQNGTDPTIPTTPDPNPGIGGGTTNPAPDSDSDGLADSQDAMPSDPLISWKKTPSFYYLWLPVSTPAGYTPSDVNNRGQMLFRNSSISVPLEGKTWNESFGMTPVGTVWSPAAPAVNRWQPFSFHLPPFELPMASHYSESLYDAVQIHEVDLTKDGIIQSFSLHSLGDDGSVMADFGLSYWNREPKNGYPFSTYAVTTDLVLGWTSDAHGAYDNCHLVGGAGQVAVPTATAKDWIVRHNYAAGFHTDAQGILRAAIFDQLIIDKPYATFDTNIISSPTSGSSGTTYLSGLANRSYDYGRRHFTHSGRAMLGDLANTTAKYYVTDGHVEVPNVTDSSTLIDLPSGSWGIGEPNAALRIFKAGQLQSSTLTGVTQLDEHGTGIGQVASQKGHDIWRNGQWFSFADLVIGDNKPPAGAVPKRITSKGIIWAGDLGANQGILIPVELRDIKNHANKDDDVSIANWNSTQNITDNNIAWIEAHTSETNAAPRMPQLELRKPKDIPMEAKLEVQYTRGNGARVESTQAEDFVRIPANGNFAQVNGESWNIYGEADWQTELTQRGFFGGDATLTYRLINGPAQTIHFRIGGRNPDDARCKAYIESLPDAGQGGNLWFAYAIAKSESMDYNGEGTRYNQFYQLPVDASDTHLQVTRRIQAGRPLFGDDRNDDGTPNGPGGYGIFQLTGTVSESTANIARTKIWNWQENATAGVAIIASKRTVADA